MSNAFVEIELLTDDPHCRWVDLCFVALHNLTKDCFQLQTLSERYLNLKVSAEVSSAVHRFVGDGAYDLLARSMGVLPSTPQNGSIRLLREPESEWIAHELREKELLIHFYRKPDAVDSRMVVHTDSCVELTHVSTGLVGRSEWERRRSANLALATAHLGARLIEAREKPP
nr:hypothetical protein [uncultured Rhodoferax sp.]